MSNRSRAKSLGQGAHHRHHRHQRQIHHHRAGRPHPVGLRLRCSGWRQYRQVGAGVVAARVAQNHLCAGDVQLPDRPGAGPGRRMSASSPTCRPITSTAMAAWRIMPPSRQRLINQATKQALIGVDDDFPPAPSSPNWRQNIPGIATPVSVGKVLGRGIFVLDGALYDSMDRLRRRSHEPVRRRICPAAQLAERGAGLWRGANPSVNDTRSDRRCHRELPGLPHRIEMSAASAKSASSMTARPPMPTPRRVPWPSIPTVPWIAGGKAKDGGIESLAEYFPRIRPAPI